ncbi:MAG: phosphatase [Chloroflexi bacterium]|nr:MAG: phosphatase [Chloroflexota bacterium]
MLQDITNYLEISPLLGTAGQPAREQFTAIKEAGYDVVINLLPSPNTLPDEQALVTGLGLDYINIPVIWQQPTPANLDDFFQAMRANQGRKVFVHCAMNMRVSAFVYLYRVLVQGEPAETAKRSLKEIWEPDSTWQAFIDSRMRDEE